MKKLSRAALAAALLATAACATTSEVRPWPQGKDAAAARFERDLTTLADDSYEGREAGTPGYDRAVAYVAGAFAEMGLKPAGEDGFLQQVPLRRATRVLEEQEGEFRNGDEVIALRPLDDLLLDAPVSTDPSATFAGAAATGGIAFAGYGIDAPELGIDSYGDLDVDGKVVLLMQGVPDGLPSEERAHFSRGGGKVSEAVRRGAVGVLFLGRRDQDEEGLREEMERLAARPDDTFAGQDAFRAGVPTGFLFKDAARRVFASGGADHDLAVTPDEDGRITPQALNGALTLRSAASFENYASPNVVAMIEGSDPALKDEYVVLSAHLDHVGMLPEGTAGDRVYNGAMDNASGIATMLETARRFSADGERPRRSVLFVAVTAEEKGLLGSDYFARNPTVPAEAMVANVNLDMPILLHDFTDVIAFGAEHSGLGPIVDEAAESMGVDLIADPVPEMVLFVRSDHYSFVKQGVPSVFLFLGFGDGGKEAFEVFMSTHYHQLSDEPSNADLPIDFEVGAKFAALNYRIAKAIADADERPEWNEGDFFGRVFGERTGS